MGSLASLERMVNPWLCALTQSVDREEPTILKSKPFKAPIYVLILDTFLDSELASEAMKDCITQQDSDIEPWIRTVESLQKVLETMGQMISKELNVHPSINPL